jgi:hypothetical protein
MSLMVLLITSSWPVRQIVLISDPMLQAAPFRQR